MLKIYFNNIKCLCVRRNVQKLFSCALNEKFAEIKKLHGKDFEVSIRYAPEDEIKEINNQYRGVDRATDVLSFPMYDLNSPDDVQEMAQEKSFCTFLLTHKHLMLLKYIFSIFAPFN